MKNLLFLCLLCLSACSVFIQSTDTIEYSSDGVVEQPKIKDGKCYAKAMIPDQYENTALLYPVYTGIGKPEGVEEKTLTLSPASTKWVKKAADKNCQSANPNDCLVWCLVEVPADQKTLLLVTDTLKIKDFKMQSLQKRSLTKAGGVTQMVEILCENAENTELYENLSTALTTRGYMKTAQKVKNDALQAALVQFQKDKGLPTGNMNVLTLQALGVKYN